MTTTINKISLKVITAIIIIVFQSCDTDQITNKYLDFEKANNDELFQKSWIPNDFVFESMTDIYQRTNIDLNTCIFSYNLSRNDIEIVKQNLQHTTVKFEKPERIRIPSWWIKGVQNLDNYLFVIEAQSDTLYFAIDEKNNKIYGWRK